MSAEKPVPEKRLFVALEMPHEVKRALSRMQQDLEMKDNRIKWVQPDAMHLTLVFLGDQDPEREAEVKRIMDETIPAFPRMSLDVAGLGFFGPERSPRVVWAGIEESSKSLVAMQRALNKGLAGAGFEVESRAFIPHLTLGRVKSLRRRRELTSALASANNTRFGSVRSDQVLLFQSQLTRQGAHYFQEHATPLKGEVHHGD